MQVDTFPIDGPLLFTPKLFSDSRGTFMESFRANVFEEHVGSGYEFVQDNQSLSLYRGTVRGLHLQTPPYAQGKLVRCVAGSILDVVVDVRRGSSTYGKFISAQLTDKGREQLWVPPGFLHGFMSCEDECVVAYKCTNYFAQDCGRSVRWDDPDLGIDWDVPEQGAILSDKDHEAMDFKDFTSPFTL